MSIWDTVPPPFPLCVTNRLGHTTQEKARRRSFHSSITSTFQTLLFSSFFFVRSHSDCLALCILFLFFFFYQHFVCNLKKKKTRSKNVRYLEEAAMDSCISIHFNWKTSFEIWVFLVKSVVTELIKLKTNYTQGTTGIHLHSLSLDFLSCPSSPINLPTTIEALIIFEMARRRPWMLDFGIVFSPPGPQLVSIITLNPRSRFLFRNTQWEVFGLQSAELASRTSWSHSRFPVKWLLVSQRIPVNYFLCLLIFHSVSVSTLILKWRNDQGWLVWWVMWMASNWVGCV